MGCQGPVGLASAFRLFWVGEVGVPLWGEGWSFVRESGMCVPLLNSGCFLPS